MSVIRFWAASSLLAGLCSVAELRAQTPPPAPTPPAPAPADGAAPAAPSAPAPAASSAPPDESTRAEPPIEVVADASAPQLTVASAEPAAADGALTLPSATAPVEPPLEVTVAGTRVAKTAGSAHVIKQKQLERFEYDDPHAVLLTVPGVYVRGEDGVGLRPNIGIRGVNPDRSKKVTLTEDGVLIAPAPYSAPAAYYFPLVTRMASVRVIKGPGAVAFGPHTVGGAVDLVSRFIPASASGMADVAVGEYGYGKAHAYFGNSTEQTGFLIEGIHLRSDGFKELPSGADTGFYRNEWVAKVSHVLDPTAREQHELRLKLTYSDEVSNETYLGLTDADFEKNPFRRYAASALDRMENHRTSVALTHVYSPSPKFSLTTTLYRNDFARSWRKVNGFRDADITSVLASPDSPRYQPFYDSLTGSSTTPETVLIGPNQRTFAAHGLQSVARWDTSTGPVAHRLEYGFRVHYDRIERRHSQNGFFLVDGELLPDGGPTEVTALNEAATDALALHAVDAVSWRALTLTPGVRVEVMRSRALDRISNEEQGQVAAVVLPGVGAFYALNDELGVLGGVYRGFSPKVPGSAAHVDPELSVNYEAGARFARGASRAELIGFYNDYSNLTDVCTISSGCVDTNLDRQFDAGEARVFGFEAYAEHAFPLGAWSVPVNVAYTRTRAEFLTSFESDDPIFGRVEKGDELPYVPREQANVAVGLEHARGGVNVGMTYVSAMREQAGDESLDDVLATDEQWLFDVSARVRPLSYLTLYLNVRNLFDSHYVVAHRPYGARPNAPRWVQVGAKVAF